jgi:hypothetical protein
VGRTRWRVVRRGCVATGAVLMILAVLAPQVDAEPKFAAVMSMPTVTGASLVNLAPFTSVSCLGATGCTATGPSEAAVGNGGGKAAYDTNGARTWSQPSTFTLPANVVASPTFSPAMDAVSCWAVEDCAAVGEYPVSEDIVGVTNTVPAPMAAVETSGVWGAASQITMPADSYGVLTGVSCVASGNCTATGLDVAKSPSTGALSFHSVTATEVGGTWSSATMRSNPTGSNLVLVPTSISCLTPSDCTLVEANESSKVVSSYVVTEVAGTWSAPQLLAGSTGEQLLAESIACTGLGSCVSVGVSGTTAAIENSGTTYPATEIETGGVWRRAVRQRLPLLSPVTIGGGLTSVSCASPSVCVAVGIATTTSKTHEGVPIALTYRGNAWGSIGIYPGPVLAGAKPSVASGFTSVSCFSTTSCMGLGESANGPITAQRAKAYSFSDLVLPVGVPRRPGSPIALRATGSKVRTTITWAPPYSDGGAPVTAFDVTVTSPGKAPHTCKTRRLECSFAGLVRGHIYRFWVGDMNKVGSSPSRLVTFTVR